MSLYLLLFCLSVNYAVALSDDKPQPTGLAFSQPTIETIPGATFSNQITLSNPSDQPSQVQLALTLPRAFRLLNHLPAALTLPPRSSRQIVLKFLIDREWNENEAVVRLETTQANTNPASTIQFLVMQNRNASTAVAFTLLDEAPYVTADQDNLPLTIRFSNQGYRPRTVRVQVFSTPEGFRMALPHQLVTISARRDTIVRLPCLITGKVQFDRSYDVAVEMQDEDGAMLGSVVCRPVLLASVKRWANGDLMGLAPNGVSVGLSRFGTTGVARELRVWGEEKVAKGTLTYQAHYLNFASQRYHELRDTYVQYQQDHLLVRAGSLYDMHELPLLGVGLKVAYAFSAHTRLEGWALRNQSNWLANLTNPNTSFTMGRPVADATYSLRLTGRLPLAGEAGFAVSSSYYSQQRFNRAGMLNFSTLQWQPNERSTLRLLAGHNVELATAGPDRRQTLGWAIGGGYDRTGSRVDVHTSAYFSQPTYAGIQRGANLLDHSLTYKKWANARLSYRLSQVRYNQQIFISPTQTTNRLYGNTVAELAWVQDYNRLTVQVRPYLWIQTQSLPSGVLQRADSYRVAASLRYETKKRLRLEAGVDGGRLVSVVPESFALPSYRYFGSFGVGQLTVQGYYQQGPFLVNDRLPGQGDPGSFRQLSVAPSMQFSLLDGRLRANVGGGMTYNSIVKAWNGLLTNTATYAVNQNLRLRLDVNALSFAERLSDVSSVPWRETQVRLEITKLFHRLPWNRNRTIRLRFFEDENGNQLKDGNERFLEGLVVHVGSTAFITDQKGAVNYKGVLAGVYPFRTVCKLSTGEPIWFQDTIRVQKSASRDVPIRKTMRITGQLRCTKSKYENQSCEFDQHKIEAHGKAGEVYRTYADENGRFTLYMPIGQYQVNISMVRTLRKTIAYRVDNETPDELQIDLEPAGRKVQIKRFTSR